MLSNKALASASGTPFVATEGGVAFRKSGTYSIVIPAGVYAVAALAIGAGGGGGGTSSTATASGAGGGGGALSYSNALAVTPGETLSVTVGAGGNNGSTSGTNGTAGGDSYIQRSGVDLLLAKGGGGGSGNTAGSTGGGGAGGAAASGVGDTKYSGGNGGARATNDRGGGGGGAAGYSGNGGTGGGSTTAPTAGAGGGGGGGYFGFDGTNIGDGGWGGGTQFYGSGSNGIAGVQNSTIITRTGGLGSSQGSTTSGTVTARYPGGGGGGAVSSGVGDNAQDGEDGAVRILWGGTKAFPSTNVTSNTISLLTSVNSATSTITIPTTVTVGDTVVLLDIGFDSSGTPSAVTPSGFTAIQDSSGANGTIASCYKTIKSISDIGASITGMNGTVSNNKILLVFRGTSGYTVVNATSAGADVSTNTSGLPVSTGSTSVDSYQQGIAVSIAAFYGSSGITPGTDLTFTGATFVQGASNVFYVGYKIYTQADTNTQTTGITMADRGTNGWNIFHLLGY